MASNKKSPQQLKTGKKGKRKNPPALKGGKKQGRRPEHIRKKWWEGAQTWNSGLISAEGFLGNEIKESLLKIHKRKNRGPRVTISGHPGSRIVGGTRNP